MVSRPRASTAAPAGGEGGGGEGRGQGWVRVAGGHGRIGQSEFSGGRGGAQCFASREANDADLS